MELSILVAKIMALMYGAIGVGFLSGQVDTKKMLKSFQDSPGLTFVSGFFMIIVGALLVQYHNIWDQGWTVLVTIIGWALLIKGTIFVSFPKPFLAMSSRFARQEKWMGVLIIAIALVFGYFGFVA